MKKLLLLFFALLFTGGANVWAQVTVTLADASVDPYGYGTRSNSNKTFTSNDASGLANLVLDVTGGVDHYTSGTYGGRLALKTADANTDETWTLTAPEGYLITGYSFSARFASSNTATINAGGTEYNISSSAYTDVAVSGLKVKTTSFTVNASAANWIAVGPFTVTLAPINFISLTFDKPGSATNNITVNVKDADGDAIPGVTATLEETSITEFKTGSAAALSRTENSVLAPNAGYANAQGSTITYTFKVEGLPSTFTYNKAALDVYALTGGGGAQGNAGGTVREWTFDVATGSATDALTSFASQENNDICTVSDQDGGLYHKLWTMDGNDKAATDVLYIKVTLTKTASLGCFAGIGEVQLFKPSATVQYVISDASGTVFTSDVVSATAGQTITELPSAYQRSYCSYSEINQTMLEGENIINVTVNYNLPFTTSTSFEDATWYYATIRGTKYLRADDNQKDSSGRYATSNTNEKTDVYKWAFFGKPYSNFYIMNKGQGDGKYLYYVTSAQPIIQTLADPTAVDNALWQISLNSSDNGSGFTVRSITGNNNYINDAGGNGNLGKWESANGANDAGSRWNIAEVPTSTIDVTYELWIDDALVNTVVDEQVEPNSDISIPSSLISAYSSLAWDFETSGEIGESDCTITVTGTMKDGVITAINQISNNKAYKLNTTRGSLGTNGTQMVSSFNTNYSASNFALINYEGNYYLYSVVDSKWVGNPSTIDEVANQPGLTDDLNNVTALTFDATNATSTSPLFYIGMGSNGINVSNWAKGIVVNSWTTRDAGNQYCIIEAADFDATDALAALEEYFHPTEEIQFNDAITTLETINWGTGLNHYSLTGDYAGYAGQETNIISGLKTAGYSEDNLTIALALLDNYALNMPTTGFYRIKGNTSSKYLAAGIASNSKFNMTTAEDASTIFYFDGTKLVNYGSGLSNGVTGSAWAWVTEDGASTVVFQDGLTNGGYAIKTSDANFYDNGDISASADRGANVTINNSTDARYTSWVLEQVTDLPLTISEAGYATLYAPVALEIPTGVTAYTGYINGSALKLEALSEKIPANTAVILQGDADDYTFTTTTADTFDGDNDLEGTIGGKASTADAILTLQNYNDKIGLFNYTGPTLQGFKAYLDKTNLGSEVHGLTFEFDTETAIQGISLDEQDGAIYNLAGQRVQKATKGLYIVNGKKMLVK